MRALAAASLFLSGCGLFLRNDPPLPEHIRDPPTAYHVEGEVRDERTLAPIPDAEVTVETDRPGYAVTRRTDPGGRFSIGYSALQHRYSSGELFVNNLFLGDETEAVLVSRISIRAEGGGQCAPIQTFPIEKAPRTLTLLVGSCATYRPRPRSAE